MFQVMAIGRLPQSCHFETALVDVEWVVCGLISFTNAISVAEDAIDRVTYYDLPSFLHVETKPSARIPTILLLIQEPLAASPIHDYSL